MRRLLLMGTMALIGACPKPQLTTAQYQNQAVSYISKAETVPESDIKIREAASTVVGESIIYYAETSSATYKITCNKSSCTHEKLNQEPKKWPEPKKLRTAAFVESEYAPYQGTGNGIISGQAFLKTRGGDVKYGAANDIIISPVTSYSTEFWTAPIENKSILARQEDPQVKPFLRVVTADGEGRFKISNLPPGEYYAYTYISWEVPSINGLEKTGGWVGAKVTVNNNTTEVILKSLE